SAPRSSAFSREPSKIGLTQAKPWNTPPTQSRNSLRRRKFSYETARPDGSPRPFLGDARRRFGVLVFGVLVVVAVGWAAVAWASSSPKKDSISGGTEVKQSENSLPVSGTDPTTLP